MATIAGVETIRNEDGVLDTIIIDAKLHPQAVKVLKEIGLIEKSPLQQEVEANPEQFMSVEKCFSSVKAEVRKNWEEWNRQR